MFRNGRQIMTRYFVRAALPGAALLASTAAVAAVNPIPGVDVIVKSHPAGILIVQSHTDANGHLVLRGLAPGNYEVDVDGRSLAAALGRLPRGGPRASAAANRGPEAVTVRATGPGVNVTSPLSYRAAAAGQAVHVRFTIRARGGTAVVVSIFDRWGQY
jgi:hypothetical protein